MDSIVSPFIYLKIKLVLKRTTSSIKLSGLFVSKYLCSLHAAHRGGSHVGLKPEETSARQASNVLCQVSTCFKTDACQVDVLLFESLNLLLSCTHGKIKCNAMFQQAWRGIICTTCCPEPRNVFLQLFKYGNNNIGGYIQGISWNSSLHTFSLCCGK